MTREQILLAQAVLGVAAACALVVAVLALVHVARLRRLVEQLRAERPTMEAEVASGPAATEPVAGPDRAPAERAFVITDLDAEPSPPDARTVAGRIEGRLFADIVARETAVRAGGLVHGLRRALAPEVRNRIAFEMRREVRRARKQRRADLKAALRDLQDRRRADTGSASGAVGDGNVA